MVTSGRALVGERDSVLLVQRGGIGDFVLGTPAFRALRRRYPLARLDLVVSGGSLQMLAERMSLFDRVVALPEVMVDRDPEAAMERPGTGAWRAMSLRRALGGISYDVAVSMNHVSVRDAAFQAAVFTAAGASHWVGLDGGLVEGLFDLAVPDLGFGARHEAEYHAALAELLDAPVVDRQPFLPVGTDDSARARSILARKLGAAGPRIGMHPGCFRLNPERRWPAEKFAELADRLHGEFGVHVLLLGGPEEASLRATVRALMDPATPQAELPAGETLLVTAAAIAELDLFVGNDSGLMHVAAAMKVPTIGIFGPTNPSAWRPYAPAIGPLARAISRAGLVCQPCCFVLMDSLDQLGCGERTCLEDLQVEEVLTVAREMLAG